MASGADTVSKAVASGAETVTKAVSAVQASLAGVDTRRWWERASAAVATAARSIEASTSTLAHDVSTSVNGVLDALESAPRRSGPLLPPRSRPSDAASVPGAAAEGDVDGASAAANRTQSEDDPAQAGSSFVDLN